MAQGPTKSSTARAEYAGAGDALLDHRAIVEALMNAPDDYVVILSREGQILAGNKAVGRRFGKTAEALKGCKASDIFDPETAERRMTQLERACQKGQIVRFEDERKGSSYDHILYPIMGKDGTVDKIVSIARDITSLKKTGQELRKSEERYRLVTERTSDMVSIVTFAMDPRYVYISPSHSAALGYEPEDLLGKCPFDFIHPEDTEKLVPLLAKYLADKEDGSLARKGNGPTERLLYRIKDRRGNWCYLESTADLLQEGHILLVSRDVTENIKKQEELQKSRDELENEVQERTRALQAKGENLEEANAALKVLLELREKDRVDIESKMLFNVRQLAEPYLQKLKGSGLNERQTSYVEILESSLSEIVSPLLRDLAVKERSLTPSELRISNLIKYGKTTKEIAEALDLSERTIESHRRRIRRKLGLKKRSPDLRSYLLTREI